MIDTVEDFYNQVIKNLYSNNLFLKQKKNFYYKDLLSYFNNFRKYILFQNKKKLRIATISKKSFSLYSSIISILLLIFYMMWFMWDQNKLIQNQHEEIRTLQQQVIFHNLYNIRTQSTNQNPLYQQN